MRKFEYTDEIIQKMAETYKREREAGKLNIDILTEISEEYNEEVSVASIRMKLNSVAVGVYVKDTETEKVELKKRKAETKKEGRQTKAKIATDILRNLELSSEENHIFADDLERLTTKSLNTLNNAIGNKNVIINRQFAELQDYESVIDDTEEYAIEEQEIQSAIENAE